MSNEAVPSHPHGVSSQAPLGHYRRNYIRY